MSALKVFCNQDSDEWMVQYPSGKVEFLGWWGFIKLLWVVVRRGQSITIVDKDGKESQA